jgi:diguanylate cyclase (GGDEF)-like protein
MLAAEPLKVDRLPDSLHARELHSGVKRLRFEAPLESVYRQVHLQCVQRRVRMWFSLLAVCAIGHILLQMLRLLPRQWTGWDYDVAELCSVTLAWLAWSRRYPRWYLPAARVLVPCLSAASALFVARDLVVGRGLELAFLTTIIFVVYSFCGLLYRTALSAGVLTVMAFLVTALALKLPTHTLGPALAILLLTASIAAIGYRDIERHIRRGFLERAVISDLVTRDELSGLTNRRAFYEHLVRLWHQAQRDGRTLAVWMVDIDHFKTYNDSFGHQAGDSALRAVGQLLKGYARRPLDLAARYGGDEFIAVLYDLPAARVRELAERMRQAVQDYHLQQQALSAGFPRAQGSAGVAAREAPGTGAVTVSLGIAVVVPTAERSVQGLVQLADEALYDAKQAGRNCVVLKDALDHQDLSTGSFRTSLTG